MDHAQIHKTIQNKKYCTSIVSLMKRKKLFGRPNIYMGYANFLILINYVKMLRNVWKKDFKNVQ